MKLKPKKHLGIIFILAFSLILTSVFLIKKTQNSSMLITSGENKIAVAFKLNSRDRQNISKILEKLYLPQSILDGISLELDSTTSAAISYVSPINLGLKTSPNAINFSTNISRALTHGQIKAENIKIPKNSNLAIFAPRLVNLAADSLPQELSTWTSENFKSTNGQFLVVFGQNADFALLEPETTLDLSSVKDLQLAQNIDGFYREETVDDTTYYLVNFESGSRQLSLAMCKVGNWQVLASSRQGAISITNAINGKEDAMEFPKYDNLQFVILYSNSKENPIDENFQKVLDSRLKLISGANPKAFDALTKVEKANFSLMGGTFSGLIKFK